MEINILKNLGKSIHIHKSLIKTAVSAADAVSYLDKIGLLKTADDSYISNAIGGAGGAAIGGLAGYGIGNAVADKYVDASKQKMVDVIKKVPQHKLTPKLKEAMMNRHLRKVRRAGFGAGAATAGLSLLGGYLGSRDY